MAMSPHPISVIDAIAAHCAAFLHDDSLFNDEGDVLAHVDDDTVNAADLAEIARFRAFISAPCLSHTDVQAKIAYMHDGKASCSQTGFEAILNDERYADEARRGRGEFDMLEMFIHSLRIREGGR
jgi:hypothetical protein